MSRSQTAKVPFRRITVVQHLVHGFGFSDDELERQGRRVHGDPVRKEPQQ